MDCLSQSFTPDTAVFMPAPAVSVQLYVGYPAESLTWTDQNAQPSVSTSPDPCGSITHELSDVTTGVSMPLDPAVFSADLISATKSITVETNDFAKAGQYQLRLVVYYASYPANQGLFYQDFIVDIVDYCIPTLVMTTELVPSSTLFYTLGDSLQTVTFDAWETVPSECSLVYQLGSVAPALEVVQSDLLTFDEPTRTISVESTADAAIPGGTYSVDITAQTADGVATGDQITLFIEVQSSGA